MDICPISFPTLTQVSEQVLERLGSGCYDLPMKRLFIAVLILCSISGGSAAPKLPNIVFILADDMSYDSVSALNPDIGPLKTPFIDKLVSEGMNFTDAHSGSAVCTPTRYGILTGRYCWRTDLKSQVLWEWGRPLIERKRLTVAEMLQDRGYSTGMVGKWHLGMTWLDKEGKVANADVRRHDSFFKKQPGAADRCKAAEARIDFTKPIADGPIQHGFDYYFGVDVPNFPPYLWIENDRLLGVPSVPKPDTIFGHPGPMKPGWKLEDILVGLAEKSVEWIEEQAKSDKPFFLYLPLTSPHTPIAPSKRFKGRSGLTKYVDFVTETDWVVGEVMNALEKSGEARNTILIFTTDNGTSGVANFKKLESHGINLRVQFKGWKGQIHEGGHRVPFIVRWPARIAAGSSCDQTICLNDFMATAAAITSVVLPENAAEDSNNILPLLLGEERTPEHSWVVNHDYGGDFAIRNGRWKLVPGKTDQLFDLKVDQKESSNVASAYPAVVEKMKAKLKEYQESGRSVSR
ncbi:MAG: arylsulfatase [Verrucomicrobiales bacterium]|nr:arylsulfatase [Verrucomicrobiales bacterium]